MVKAAQTAAAKAVGPVASTVSNRLARRRLETSLRDRPELANADEAGDAFRPEEARDVAEYVNSPEFEELALQLAIHAATDSPKRELAVLDRVRTQMLAHLAQQTRLDEPTREEVADLLVSTLDQAVGSQTIHTLATRKTQGEVFGRQVAAAAAVAAAQARNTELLTDIKQLAGVLEFSDAIRERVRRTHARIEILQLGARQQVPYRELWVKPRLSASTGLLEMWTVSEPLLLAPEDVMQLVRCVVIGDPGAGKSTLSNWLAYAVASDEIPGFTGRVPFLLVLRDLATELEGGGRSLVEIIARVCKVKYVEPPGRALEYLLRNGRAVVILDGLDELASESSRLAAVRLIEGFSTEYPTTTIVVTARRVGYEETALDHDRFDTLSLAPFEDKQIAEYVEKWFRLEGGTAATESDPAGSAPDPRTAAFLAESESVQDLRSNPLLLSLLCALYQWEGYLPENRPKIYGECSRLLTERWDGIRGVAGRNLPLRQSLTGVLADVAWWMWSSDAGLATGVSRAALENRIVEYLMRTRFDNRDDAEDLARQFVDFCSDRAWVLTQVGVVRGSEMYAFTHRTFMEYYAALYLVRTHQDTGEFFEAVVGQIHSATSAVVAELAVHEFDTRTDSGTEVIERLLDLAEQCVDPVELERLIGFAARCMGFVNPREATVGRLVAAATSLAIGSPRDEARSSVFDAPLSRLFKSSSRENHDLVVSRFMGLVTGLLEGWTLDDNEPYESLVQVALALSYLRAEFRVEPTTGQYDSLLKEHLHILARKRSWAAALALVEESHSFEDAWRNHGPSVFFHAPTLAFHNSGSVLYHPARALSRTLTTEDAEKLVRLLLDAGQLDTWARLTDINTLLLADAINSPLFDSILAMSDLETWQYSLAILASLPIVEAYLSEGSTVRSGSRLNRMTAAGWLDEKGMSPDDPAAAPAFVADLVARGLHESCRELVTGWINGSIDLVARQNEDEDDD